MKGLTSLFYLLFLILASVNSYAYTSGVSYTAEAGSDYRIDYSATFFDSEGNEISMPDVESSKPFHAGGSHHTGATDLSNDALVITANPVGGNSDISFENIAASGSFLCEPVRSAECAESVVSFYDGVSGLGLEYIEHFSELSGTAPHDMYVETSITEKGEAYIRTDYPELYDIQVDNPLLEDPREDLFEITWEEETTTERLFITEGEQWSIRDGYATVLNGHLAAPEQRSPSWELTFTPTAQFKNDFIQFFLGNDGAVSPVSDEIPVSNEIPIQASAVPLPASVLLLGPGLFFLGFFRRKS